MPSTHPLRIIWSYKRSIIIVAIAAAVLAYVASHSQTPKYTADAVVQVIPTEQVSGGALQPQQLLQLSDVYLEVSQTTPVLARSAKNMTPPVSTFYFSKHASSATKGDLGLIDLTGESTNPKQAAEIANAYAKGFVDAINNQTNSEQQAALAQINKQINDAQSQITQLSGQLNPSAATKAKISGYQSQVQALQQKLADQIGNASNRISTIESAAVPGTPSSPRPKRDAALALIAALLLGSGAALLWSLLAGRYSSAEEASMDLGIPIIGELPRAAPDDPAAIEAFRGLRTGIAYATFETPDTIDRIDPTAAVLQNGAGGGGALQVTSANLGAGKSYVAANLARALAAEGRAVAAVEGDLRRPTLAQQLEIRPTPGVGDVLHGEDPGLAPELIQPVRLPPSAARRGGELHALPVGRRVEDPAEALSSKVMSDSLKVLEESFGTVVIDSPPVLGITDALVLVRYSNAVLFVVDARRTSRVQARRAIETLRAINAPIVGLVFNRSKTTFSPYYQEDVRGSRLPLKKQGVAP
jgi:Mrp family chromosome partitioning ATPase/capsular polysaccharide biosynthesis protein